MATNVLEDDHLISGAKIEGLSGLVSGGITSVVVLFFGGDVATSSVLGIVGGAATFFIFGLLRNRRKKQLFIENEELKKDMLVQFTSILSEVNESSKLEEWNKIKLQIASSALSESNQKILERELIVGQNISHKIDLSAEDYGTISTRDGLVSTKGDITINQFVNSIEQDKALAEIKELRMEMDELRNMVHTDEIPKSDSGYKFDLDGEEFQKKLAFEANKRAEIMIRSGNFNFSGWTFKELGDIAYNVGEYDVARGHFRSAYKIFTAEGDTVGQGRALNDLGNVAKQTGDIDEARRKYFQALNLGEKYNHNATKAASLGNLAIISEGGDAAAYYEKAESIFKKEGDWVGYARQFLNRVYSDPEILDIQEFQEKTKKTIELLDDLGERMAKVHLLQCLAHLERKMDGVLEEEYLWASHAICKDLGEPIEETTALNLLIHYYRRKNKLDEEKEISLQLVEILKEIGHQEREAQVLDRLGYLARDANEWKKSEKFLNQSLAIWREIGSRGQEAGVLVLLARNALDQNEFERANKLFLDSLSIIKTFDDGRSEAIALNNFAYSLQLKNKPDEAEEYARKGLAIANKAEDRSLEALLFWTLGEILDAKELNDAARDAYKNSADIKREIGEELDQFFIDNDY